MCTYQLLPETQHSSEQTATFSPVVRKRTIRFRDEDASPSSGRPMKRARGSGTSTSSSIIQMFELPNVPLASQMTQEERNTLWMHQHDHRATYSDVASVIRTCQASGDDDTTTPCNNGVCDSRNNNNHCQRTQDAYVNFAEALATAYNICNEDDDNHDSCERSTSTEDKDLPLDQMVVFGSAHTQSRGLESKIIPGLGGHRSKKRKEHILGVLGVQRELRTIAHQHHAEDRERSGDTDTASTTTATAISPEDANDMAEGLGAVSEYLSKSSRRFARALGAVDGTMALLEHASVATPQLPTTTEGEGQQQQQHQQQPQMMNETQASCIGAFLSMQALDCIVT